jgi:CheY-like chemotaxis protein
MIMPAIRVLIVDDEPAIRRALRPPLLELGFQVAEASRGEEALQMLRAAVYDVVLLDVNMPGIGGVETLRRIRAFAPGCPSSCSPCATRKRTRCWPSTLGPTTMSPSRSAPGN